MKKETWQFVAAAILAILAVWLLVAVSACAGHYIPIVRYDPSAMGGVRCDQKGNIVILMSETSRRDSLILAHEHVHIEQMYREGGCRAFEKHYSQDSIFALQTEAEAYCRTGVQADDFEAILGLASFLRGKYQPNITLDSVFALMPCGGRHYGAPHDTT